ncbi:MAG TPA: LysR family transcriptional regulator [Nocardioidaceae bacterium]|nr:LysR family transcriptional regulator [Nocardioidaceae bacterium]
MDLRQLRYFVAVAEELHFTRAAARLLITTPSLSQQVRRLEGQLGVRLFDRSSTGVRLTASGELLLPHARRTLAAAEELAASAVRLAQGQTTVLRLGFISYSLTEPARRLLTEYARCEPDVDLQLRQYEWDDPSAGLLDGSSDAALVRLPFTGAERLNAVEIGRDALFAVMAEDSPLAREPRIRARRLVREPILETKLVSDPVFADHWFLRRLGGRARPVPSAARTVDEWLGEIALGKGVDVVPEGLVDAYRRPGLAFVPVDDLQPSVLVLAWDPRRDSDAVTRLARLAAPPPVPA